MAFAGSGDDVYLWRQRDSHAKFKKWNGSFQGEERFQTLYVILFGMYTCSGPVDHSFGETAETDSYHDVSNEDRHYPAVDIRQYVGA